MQIIEFSQTAEPRQDGVTRIIKNFELRHGESDGASFDVYAPGRISARAEWGGFPSVRLSIQGPKIADPLSVRDGPSPLVADAQVNTTILQGGVTCRVRIDGDLPEKRTVVGKLTIDYPAGQAGTNLSLVSPRVGSL